MLVFDASKHNLELYFSDAELLHACYDYGMRFSDDPSTKLGALLLNKDGNPLCFGANRFPKGVEVTPERLERSVKLLHIEHAERDVILQAARDGHRTEDGILYAPWFACADCARVIIGAGIRRVVGHQAFFDRTPERWRESIEIGHQMMREAGIEMEFYDKPIGNGAQSQCSGEVWYP